MERDPRSRWEMVSGLVALVVGVAALGVTAYTAYLQRKQARAAVWPEVQVGLSGNETSFEVVFVNKGVGPARVRDFRLAVDGRPLSTWPDFIDASVIGEWRASTSMNLTRRTLTPGETATVFSITGGGIGRAFVVAIPRITEQICYCSIFDECWLNGSGFDEPRPVPQCPAPSGESFIGVDLHHIPIGGRAQGDGGEEPATDAGSPGRLSHDR